MAILLTQSHFNKNDSEKPHQLKVLLHLVLATKDFSVFPQNMRLTKGEVGGALWLPFQVEFCSQTFIIPSEEIQKRPKIFKR